MSSTSAPQSNEYDLVSSFYGPGAVVGWYLTVLACLVSYCLHPRKRIRDSITADLIAVLTFPTVAAADLITHVRSYPKEGATLAQKAASIEATLIVTETFLAIDVVLFLLAVGFKCVRRGCLLATMGLFCFSAEWYVYFSPFVNPAIEQQLERLFLIDFGNLLICVMGVLCICIMLALSLITSFFSMRSRRPRARPSEQDAEASRRERQRDTGATPTDWEQDFNHSRLVKVLVIITSLFLPLAFATAIFPLSSNVVSFAQPPFLLWIRLATSRLAHDLIPKSNTSIKELDQAATLLAGASVLGFNLYSTADTYCQAWLSKTRAINQQRGTELRPLNRN